MNKDPGLSKARHEPEPQGHQVRKKRGETRLGRDLDTSRRGLCATDLEVLGL